MKKFVSTAGKILFAVNVVLLGSAVELFIRSLDIVEPFTPQSEIAIKLYYEDPNGLVQLRPGAHYFTNGNVPMEINAEGYRDKLYSRPRTKGVLRITIIGDSFTMGDGVPMEHSYPKQLESLFIRNGQTIEVLNFGITATNTLNQLALLKAKVLTYDPDLVILGFNLNDYNVYEDTSFGRARRAFGVDFIVNSDKTVTVVPPSRTFFEKIKTWMFENFASYRLLIQIRNMHFALPTREFNPESILHHEAFEKIHRAILDMSQLLRKQDVNFLVLVLPAMTLVNRQLVTRFGEYPFGLVHSDLKQFLENNQILFFDTLPEFDNNKISDFTVSRFDPHFNRQGNVLIARALYNQLNVKKILERTDTNTH